MQTETNGLPAQTGGNEQSAHDNVLTKVTSSLALIKETYPAMDARANRAYAALSMVKQVTSDEEDIIANNLMVKGRATIEDGKNPTTGEIIKGIIETRKTITGVFDDLKTLLMNPEKKVAGELVRIKGLRDAYANKKIRDAQEIKRQADLTNRKNNEKARIKAAIKQNIVDGNYKALQMMEETVKTHVSSMTLENWESKMKPFNIQPKLRENIYLGFFEVPYDKNLVTEAEYNEIALPVKNEETYEKVNGEYVKIAEGTLKAWKDTELPAKKEALEKIAELEKTNPEEAESFKQHIEQAEGEREASRQEDIATQQQNATQAIKDEHDTALLENNFVSQVTVQASQPTKASGTRTKKAAVITATDTELPKVIYNVLLACFSNPKFEGHLKRKKGVLLPPDANGNPVYADWLQPLLDFVANETNVTIGGIELKEVASTAARK